LLIGNALLAGLLALGAVACDDDEDGGNGEEPTATVPTDGGEEPTATEPAGAESVTVDLLEVDGSGVTGTATLTVAGVYTDVEVTIDGGLEPGTHQNHIHTGTCEEQGPVEVPLTDLEAGEDGSAAATVTNVTEALSSFTDGDNYVAVHALDGSVVACGNIEA
jgi:hypothetical protein